MDKDLEEILRENPFSEELIKSWKKRLDEGMTGGFGTDNQDDWYVLKDDAKAIAEYNAKRPREFACRKGYEWDGCDIRRCKRIADYRLHPEFIPQTFIGHPSAPIWLLTINPSWFESDVGSILSVDSAQRLTFRFCTVQENRCERMGEDRLGRYKKNSLGKDIIRTRQEIMLDQLRLSKEALFFPLVEKDGQAVFDVSEDGDMCSWWRGAVLGAEHSRGFPLRNLLLGHPVSELSKVLFVLEALPYRSAQWDPTGMFGLSRAYGAFWEKLVRYACTHGKTLIVRAEAEKRTGIVKSGSRIVDAVRSIARECDPDAITGEMFGFVTARNVKLSTGCVCTGKGAAARKFDELVKRALCGIRLIDQNTAIDQAVLDGIDEIGRSNLLFEAPVGHTGRAGSKKKELGKMNKIYSLKEVAGSFCEAWAGISEFEDSSKWSVFASCLKTGVFQRVAVSWHGSDIFIASAVKTYSQVPTVDSSEYSICVHIHDSFGNVDVAAEVIAPKGSLKLNDNLPMIGEAKYWHSLEAPDRDSFLFYEQGKSTETPCAIQNLAAAKRFVEAFCQRVSDALIDQGLAVVSVLDETSFDRIQDRLTCKCE